MVLVHCNIINNQYQCDSRDLCAFVPHKSFGQLLTKFHQKNIFTQKRFILSFHPLKYGLVIKTLCQKR